MSSTTRGHTDWRLIVAVTIAVISWASAWVSIRQAVAFYSPGQLALGRYLVALVALSPLAIARRPRFSRAHWPLIAASGLFGFTFYNLFINTGEQTITAGAAALIASTIPVFSTLGARIFLGEPIVQRTVVGGLLAMGGVTLIALGDGDGFQLSVGALLVLLASVCAAVYGVLQKRLLRQYKALDLTTVCIAVGVVGMLPFGGGLVEAVRQAPAMATFNLVLLGIFPGALGYVLWTYSMGRMAVGQLTTFLYLVAPLSVVMGWVFLRELPSPVELVGGGIALAGVIWAQWRPAVRASTRDGGA